MSESIRTEEQRRVAELEALVSGQAREITRLTEELDEVDAVGRAVNLRDLTDLREDMEQIHRIAGRHRRRKISGTLGRDV